MKIKDFLTSGEVSHVRLRQYLLGGTAFVLALALVIGAALLFDRQEDPETPKAPETATEIESGGSRIKPEEMWRFQMEEDARKLREDLKTLKEALAQRPPELPSTDPRREETVQNLQATIEDLQGQIARQMTTKETLPASSEEQAVLSPDGIQKFTLSSWGGGSQPVKTVLNTIPAGAFARSVLLSGLDASAAMSASTDPRPMLLRLVESGTLPRRFKSDLRDCHMTASAYGDLSSERVYARLEKLTCTVRKTGEIIETQVAGYVAGPDGKAGIRGKVVSKDVAFLERSLIGGLFSGLSNIANPQNRQSLVNPFSAGNPKVDAPSAKDMFSSGMAQGVSNALDRLSQYYINRAEQLQPVIQVAAGQVVDVVFTEGTAFGSHGVKDKIARTRAENAPRAETPHPSSYDSPAEKDTLQTTSSSSIQKLPLGDLS